jgi:outer membrane receptor protein involved in Fe transport
MVFNASVIDSKVNLGKESLGQSNERPLQGQSPYIVNAGLYYNDTDRGLQFSALYNVIGPRIFIIGFDQYPDIYEMPRNLLEVTSTIRLSKSFDLRVGVGDLFNQPNVLLQDANGDGRFERNNDQVIQRYQSGRTFLVGLNFHFDRPGKGE